MSDAKERALKAFKVTRVVGIPDSEVKPVLKHLLKVFDWHWEPIEADNYRALIDAYYELKESNKVKKDADDVKKEVLERVCELPQLDEQEDQASSCTMYLNGCPRASGGPLARNNVPGNLMSQSNDSGRSGSKVVIASSKSGEVKLLLHYSPSGRKPYFRIPDINAVLKYLEDKYLRTCKLVQPQFSAMKMLKDLCGSYLELGTVSRERSVETNKVVIASSKSREIKLLLHYSPSGRKPSFRIPDTNAVLKYLEDKYLRTYKLVQPQFSAMKMLKDLCGSYLELGTVSRERSVETNSSPEVGKVGIYVPTLGPRKRGITAGNTDTVSRKKSSSSSHVVNIHPGRTTLDEKRYFHKLIDITKGQEKVKISLVDEIGKADLPKFNYLKENTVYQNASVQISLARIADADCCSTCSGDCLSSPLPCACARETGGVFAYNQEGTLTDEFLGACISTRIKPQEHHFVYCDDCPLERSKNEYMPEPCKGHLVRKFIQECWRKCGCDRSCGNRVVQRGISCNLQVFMTAEDKGWGVRTLSKLPKGAFVCEYVGEILTNTELYERNMQSSTKERHTYPVTLDADWGSEKILKDEEALCLDATFNGNVARFINHRCNDANLIDIPVEVETPDRHYYHLAFFTTREVRAFEELTWDYGIDFHDHDHPIKAFQCSCGSACCRDVKQKGENCTV